MPPTALRCSPTREIRAENHKQGRSLEGGLVLKEKDDDLALFNEMQTRESDNFLLQSADDFDDSLSTKLRYFSESKLGVSIPARGENSDLLIADADKNDYDWLLTPPDTPLFPSLDDETPPVNLAHRGRPQSQPISISRSTTMEKGYKSSRSSASPHRLSPSPRSGSGTFQSRGRPSSTPHSSPTPALQPTTPSHRPATPPSKPSTPAPRSSTPTPRRVSTGSSGTVASSGRRGTSPVNTSRGNSTSPKFRAWQSNISGFSSDAPPNLRTSLTDRPTTYVRGSSPASRNGMVPSSKFERQSMSPTASRSASSSYSHDRDRYSSHSKGSVASSGDDDVDSSLCTPVGISDYSAARKVGAFPSSRAQAFSKKPFRTVSSASAPKTCFDSPLRQMDHRKSPRSMFRPLLSSVPSTTFYVGKANSAHRPMISRNSSVTTSSNASSEQGARVAPATEGSDHDQDDMASDPAAQDEVFDFDKVDEIHDEKQRCTGHFDFERDTAIGFKSSESEKFNSCSASSAIATTASESSYADNAPSEFNYLENLASCSKCGRKFTINAMEGNNDLCPDCCDECLTLAMPATTVIATRNPVISSEMTPKENKCFNELEPLIGVPVLPEPRSEAMLVQHDNNVEQNHNCLPDSLMARSIEEGDQHLVELQMMNQPTVGSHQSESDIADKQLQRFNAPQSLAFDGSEGTGISLLLQRSSSSKWPVIQGRTFTATNIPCEDPSYARESVNSVRSSIGYGSASTSSSVDWSSSKPKDIRGRRQLSSKKADLDNFRHDLYTKPQSTRSSFSGISNNAYQALIHANSTSEENLDVSVGNMEYEALEEILLVTEEQERVLKIIEFDDRDSSFIRAAVLEEDKPDSIECCRTVDASASELSSHTVSILFEHTSVVAFQNDEDSVSSENAEDFPVSASDIDAPGMTSEFSFIEEDGMLKSTVYGIDIVEAPTRGSLITISGELENCRESMLASQTDCAASPKSKGIRDEFPEPSAPTTSEKDASVFALVSNITDHADGILEGSTVTVEGPAQRGTRSLSLDEATDSILFCSSILHNVAYQAVNIAVEKEMLVPLDASRPTVTILGNSSSDRKDPRARTSAKGTPKNRKFRQRQVETDMKVLSTNTETDVKNNESLTHDAEVPNKADSARPPKLESKCNCTVM